MNTTEDFWADSSRWPTFDPPGWTFLARATARLGEAMFPGVWTGAEATTPKREVLPAHKAFAKPYHAAWADAVDRRERARVFAALPPDQQLNALRLSSLSLGRFSRSLQHFTDEEWTRLATLSRSEIEAATPLKERWEAVKLTLAQSMAAGKLGFALRQPNGFMLEGWPELWNVDAWPWRFWCCQMHPAKPAAAAVAGDGFLPIFVSTSDMEPLLSAQSPRGSELSPTVAGEARARADLEALVAASRTNGGNLPVGAQWRPQAQQAFNISERGARRVWDAVASENPELRSLHKPKAQRPQQ